MLQHIQTNGIPSEWMSSKITPLYKQKGDPLKCVNYRWINLLNHCLKLWDRVTEARLREMVNISKRQFGFQKRKSAMQPMFCLRMLQEKMRERQKALHMVFINLEKADDMVPRDLFWYCLRKRGIVEEYVRVIRDRQNEDRCGTPSGISTQPLSLHTSLGCHH